VLTRGRRPARSARGATLRCAAALVTRPAKGEILVLIEVSSVRPTDSHAWERSESEREEVALDCCDHPVALGSYAPCRLCTVPKRGDGEKEETQYRGAGAFVTLPRAPTLCDGLDDGAGSIAWSESGVSNP
jgi:hypothetical protein